MSKRMSGDNNSPSGRNHCAYFHPKSNPNPSMAKPFSFNLLPLFFHCLLLLTSSATSPIQDDESHIISRFQQYLQINTSQPSPDYQKSTQFLLSQSLSLSLESQVLQFVERKPIVLLKWPGSDPSLPSILLNSHTDVVPSEHSKWTHPPFGSHIDEEGNNFARGSQDMKCVGM
ncbi:hypothetical protein V6N13_083067, partial [Hibiscus sabdariffa]